MSRFHTSVIYLAIVTGSMLGGCGLPQSVTYDDPNPSGIFPGTQRNVTSEYGRAAVERTRAFMQVRARVHAARLALEARHTNEARAHLEAASQESLVTALGAVGMSSPREAPPIIARWIATGATPPPASGVSSDIIMLPRRSGQASLNALDRALADREQLVMPRAAQRDPGWNAAIAALLVEDAAAAYEQASLVSAEAENSPDEEGAPVGGDTNGDLTAASSDAQSLWIAYATGLMRMSRDLAERIPAARRQPAVRAIDSFENTYLIQPRSGSAAPTAKQAEDVYGASDQITSLLQQAGGAIADSSEPRSVAPSCLDQTAARVDSLATHQRTQPEGRADAPQSSTAASSPHTPATTDISSAAKADRVILSVIRQLHRCSNDIASVDPAVMGRLEFAVGVTLPAVLSGRVSYPGQNEVIASINADIDQARSLVQDELKALQEQ